MRQSLYQAMILQAALYGLLLFGHELIFQLFKQILILPCLATEEIGDLAGEYFRCRRNPACFQQGSPGKRPAALFMDKVRERHTQAVQYIRRM